MEVRRSHTQLKSPCAPDFGASLRRGQTVVLQLSVRDVIGPKHTFFSLTYNENEMSVNQLIIFVYLNQQPSMNTHHTGLKVLK